MLDPHLPPTVLAWFERLSLRTKLGLAFGMLIGLMLGGGMASLLSHGYTLKTVEAFLDGDNRIAALSLESSAAMQQARRYEKEFLLKVQIFDYAEAKSRYATLVADQLATVRSRMAAIRERTGDRRLQEESLAIAALTDQYEAGFAQVVALYGRQGHTDSGLAAQFRARAHALEALLAADAPERLRTDLLALRRHEKDFQLRGVHRHAEAFAEAATRFEQDLARAGLAPARQARLQQLLGQYRALFDEYVAVSAEIDTLSQAYLDAAHRIEPALAQLHADAGAAAVTTHAALQRINRAASLALSVADLMAILLGLLVATLIVGNLNRALAACTDFAGRLAAGDWAARLPAAVGGKEFARLAASLNRMAAAMQQTHRDEEQRSAELGRLNRTLRMLSRCNEALVRATSEAELLNAICRQIIDSGGYRLAWVGLACHDAGKSVHPAAFAGSGGDYVAALNLTWGEDEQRRGVGGSAIRDGRPAVARHIDSDPVFAPWREEALKQGFASCLALPLRGKREVLGTLSIYAAEADAFDAEETQLLQELADDLAFGMVSLREAAAREEAERALDYQANYDHVTGLPNRHRFTEHLRQAMLHAARAGRQVAVLVLGVDRFKAIHDSLGHAAGDSLLRHVGHRLTAALREGDTVAHLAGGEFAVLLDDLLQEEDVAPLAAKLLDTAQAPFSLDGHAIGSGASLGISLYPKDGMEAERLLQFADAAMSSAKTLGGNLFRFFAPEMNERTAALFAMESDLRRALEREELRVHFQPRVNLASGEICGAEALMRWQHPEHGLIAPAAFIPVAEATGLIEPMGEWIIRRVCAQQRAWLDAGLAVPPVAINLSPRQFRQAELMPLIRRELEAQQLEARHLEMEITESTLIDNPDAGIATLHQLRELGIKLSLDDFGAGQSSLSRLRGLPIDHLKISQSFVRSLTTDPDDAAICLAIIGLAHHLRLRVVAKGVESEGQANYLRQQHCDEMQGFHFSRALPAEEFAHLLSQRRTLDLPAQPPAEQRTLLLVDDELSILSALKRVLRRDGYQILTANSAEEGLELLATNAVQVIMSDQRMPGMNGTEFLSRVRDLYPNTVRMVLSGYTDLDTITEAINRGAIYKFLTKPWDEEPLRTEVRQAFLHHEA